MSFEPAIIAFILAAVIGGVALIMSASADWELSHELSQATERWTAPIIVRRYVGTDDGRHLAAKEASILATHGYAVSGPVFPATPPPGERILVTYVLGHPG